MTNYSKKISLLFSFLLIIFFSACKKDTVLNDDENTDGKDMTSVLMEILNDYRGKGCNCGSEYYPPVPALKINDTLTLAAKDHCLYMKNTGNFSHQQDNGSNVWDRISAYNYKWSYCGENIANGFQTEKDVMEGWIKSEGHCKNIMNPEFTETGIARNGDYWTQVFASH